MTLRTVLSPLVPLERAKRSTAHTGMRFLLFAVLILISGAVVSYAHRRSYFPFIEGDRVAVNIFLTWECIRPLLGGAETVISPIPSFLTLSPSSFTCSPRCCNPWSSSSPWLLFPPKDHTSFAYSFSSSGSLLSALTDSSVNLLASSHLSHSRLSLTLRILTSHRSWRRCASCGCVVRWCLQNFKDNSSSVFLVPSLPPNEWIPSSASFLVYLMIDCALWNLYSVSECHDVAVTDLSSPDALSGEYAPAGQIMDNVEVFVMDEERNILPRGMWLLIHRKRECTEMIGAVGELYVGGTTLGLFSHFFLAPLTTSQTIWKWGTDERALPSSSSSRWCDSFIHSLPTLSSLSDPDFEPWPDMRIYKTGPRLCLFSIYHHCHLSSLRIQAILRESSLMESSKFEEEWTQWWNWEVIPSN